MVTINQDFHELKEPPASSVPGAAQTDQRAPKTVYDLPPGSPPYSTRDEHGNITNHEPKPGIQPGGESYEDHQQAGMDKGKVDAGYFNRIQNMPGIVGGPAPDTDLNKLVKGFVKDTFEDEDTGRLEAGRAIAAARSVAGRGQGSASGGMLAHAADVSQSAAERAQEKMFGRKLAVSGVADRMGQAELEIAKMDENTRRNALAAVILGASGGMDSEQVQAIIEAYENGDSQAQAIIHDLWNNNDKNNSGGSSGPPSAGSYNAGTHHIVGGQIQPKGTVTEKEDGLWNLWGLLS